MVAMKTDQIVLIPFVVAKKEILAVYAAVVVPPLFGFSDGFSFGVCIASEGNSMLREPFKNGICARADNRK